MRECTENHPRCNKRRSGGNFVPTRLIDVSTMKEGYIRLIETKDKNIEEPYATLSHSWGPDPNFLSLRARNLKQFLREGIPVCDLGNKNFSQTLRVCQQLGVRYIWIDSLCIIQHWLTAHEQPPKEKSYRRLEEEDWHHEAPFMHQVYRNSHCNIAAADSKDAQGGLFRPSLETDGVGRSMIVPAHYTPVSPTSLFGDRTWRVIPGDLWQRELLGAPLYKRAWVFQGKDNTPSRHTRASQTVSQNTSKSHLRGTDN